MIPATRKVMKALLEDRYFGVGVDLGCGIGSAGRFLKPHFGWLIGVDHNAERIEVTSLRGHYDKVVLADLQEYQWPYGTEAAFLIDVIEHMPKQDGFQLLSRLRSVPFVVITTPSRFHPWTYRNRHVSLWTPSDFEAYGFGTMLYHRGLESLISGPGILAVTGI